MEINTSNKNSFGYLNQNAWNLRYKDSVTALSIATDIKETAFNVNFSEYYFAQLTIAQLQFWKSSTSESFLMVSEALNYFKQENILLGIARANLISAGMYDQFGQYDKAMHHALEGIKSSKLINDEPTKADCFTVLGQVFSRINDYEKAIINFEKGLTIRNKLNDINATASSLNLIARNYVLSKKYDDAFTFYDQSLELRLKNNDLDGIPWTYLGLASLFAEKKEWHISLDFYKKAEEANLKGEKRFELVCLIGVGKVLINLSEITKAVACLEEAYLISEALNISPLKAEVHELLSDCLEKTGDLKSALFHFKKFDAIRQEILSNDKVNAIKNQQIAFSIEGAEKEAEISRLKNVELKNAFDTIAIQHQELEEKSKEITDSITYAKRIQDAYLPNKKSFNQLFPQAFILFKPKDIVSGDFYWFNKQDGINPSILFTAADCTGHGVPGALMSMICCNALNEAVKNKQIHEPHLILNNVRDNVVASFKKQDDDSQKDGMDISLVRIIERNNKYILQYAGANNPLWIIKKGQPNSPETQPFSNTHYLVEIKADKQPIGIYEKMVPFTLNEIEIEKGDTIYSFTDGYADQFGGESGKKLKQKKLKELLLSIQDKLMKEQHDILLNFYNAWKNDLEQIDDVCIVAVRI